MNEKIASFKDRAKKMFAENKDEIINWGVLVIGFIAVGQTFQTLKLNRSLLNDNKLLAKALKRAIRAHSGDHLHISEDVRERISKGGSMFFDVLDETFILHLLKEVEEV